MHIPSTGFRRVIAIATVLAAASGCCSPGRLAPCGGCGDQTCGDCGGPIRMRSLFKFRHRETCPDEAGLDAGLAAGYAVPLGRFHPVPTRPVFGPASEFETPPVQFVPAPIEHLPPQPMPHYDELPQMPLSIEPEEARLGPPDEQLSDSQGQRPNPFAAIEEWLAREPSREETRGR